jgi:outer membrane lipopolysaccharide assembly protein LptE/RlpB
MRTLALTFVLSIAAVSVTGCSFHARDADGYRKATREVLETRSGDIQGCYDTALKTDAKVGGLVVVKFKVEAKTGKLVNTTVVPEQTTAPAALSECVVKAIDGLKIDPPDEREGDATFQWSFEAKTS